MRFLKIEPRAVQSLREKLGISQQELAARVGCSLSAVQFWEAGRSSPRGPLGIKHPLQASTGVLDCLLSELVRKFQDCGL